MSAVMTQKIKKRMKRVIFPAGSKRSHKKKSKIFNINKDNMVLPLFCVLALQQLLILRATVITDSVS